MTPTPIDLHIPIPSTGDSIRPADPSTFKQIFEEARPPRKESSLPSFWKLVDESQDEESEESDEALAAPASLLNPLTDSPAASEVTPVTRLFFETMVNEVQQLVASKETQTTFFLNSPLFKHSPFYGTKITIREFSTAPKAFNIEIATSPIALAHITTHQASLMYAFSEHRSLFSVNRLDLQLHIEEKPLFHRKPAAQNNEELS